jgi:hypothetical protein
VKKKSPKIVPITVEQYSVAVQPPAFTPHEVPQIAIKMSVVGGLCKFALVMDGVEMFAAQSKQKPTRKKRAP